MGKHKSKIKTGHEGPLSVTNPFAEIQMDNLPEGPAVSSNPAVSDSTAPKRAQSKGRVDVTREKSGRAGKTVTVLRKFPKAIALEELDTLAFQLKKHCACGGSLKERTIELQGDVCETVMRELEKWGFKPVRCGG